MVFKKINYKARNFICITYSQNRERDNLFYAVRSEVATNAPPA